MSKHITIRAGAGIGLAAASVAAIAQDVSSFARPMVFMRMDAGKTYYAAFMPWFTAGAASGPVLYLDLYQSGTVSTWAFGAAYADNADSVSWAGAAGEGDWGAADLTYYDPVVGDTQSVAAVSLWGGDIASKKLSNFNLSVSPSSGISCNVSLDAVIGTDGYLSWSGIKVQPLDFSTWYSKLSLASIYAFLASSGVSSGTTTVSLVTFSGSAELSAISLSKSMPTFSHARVYISAATDIANITAWSSLSTHTADASKSIAYPGSAVAKAWNSCLNTFNFRKGQNNPSAALGGKAGFMRIW